MDDTQTAIAKKHYIEHAMGQICVQLNNKRVSQRMKEKRDLEFELEMKYFDEDIIKQQTKIRDIAQSHPDLAAPYQEWLTRNGLGRQSNS